MRSRTSNPSARQTLSDTYVATTVPPTLAAKLRRLSEIECSSLAATARRLMALGVERELARHVEDR